MNTKLGKKDVLQAVVLADDFSTSFPLSRKFYPSILMPVANVPLLDYLIETLIKSKVQEVFLYCSVHVDPIKNYVKEKKYNSISVSFIVSDGCRSLGDALRDIDTKGLIRTNFILVRGDAFIATDLKNALTVHASKLEKDKGAAMTMLMRNIGSTKNSLLMEEASLLVSEKISKKVLFYKKLGKDEKNVNLELNWFLESSKIEINSNSLDTHVYLCSPSVLPLFSDNFDFQTMEDFIKGVLMNEEILDTRIYWQELNPGDYSLPNTSWKMFHVLTHDILHRLSFPLTPGAFSATRKYLHQALIRRNHYKHCTATLTRGSVLQHDSMLGANSMLGEQTIATGSIIGDNCILGRNVVVKNSYVYSGTRIKDNCIINNSIILFDCTIESNVQLNQCIVSPKTLITENSNYSGHILELKDGKLVIKELADIDGMTAETLLFEHKNICDGEDQSSDESSYDESSERNSPIPDDTSMFLSEVIDSLLRGYQDKLNCENLILEINSSRYAYNVGIREVTYNVIKAILSLPLHYLTEGKQDICNANYQKTLKMMLNYFHTIIQNYVKTEDAEGDCLRAVEDVASTTQELLAFVQQLVHYFYQRDILSEKKILEWYTHDSEEETDFQNKKVKTAVQPFIKWLEEAEEDSSESDDDSS